MKNRLILLIFLMSCALQAQDSWNVIVQDGVSDPLNTHKKMIKTSDGNFVILLKRFDDSGDFLRIQNRLLKYNDNGELLWDKRYDFGVVEPATNGQGGARPSSNLLELSNGDLVMNGTYIEGDTSKCYFFKTNGNGDSLITKMYNYNHCFNQLSLLNNEIYAMQTDNETSEKTIMHFSEDGIITVEAILEETDLSKYVLNNNSILTVRSTFQTIFRQFDFEGDLINEFSFDPDYGKFIIPNNQGGITGYSEGLIKLDANLNELWHKPIEELFVSVGSGLQYYGLDITPTPDNGYILAGHAWQNIEDAFVYLVKVDEYGNRQWGGLYGPQDIGLNYIFDVEPVSDGYVFTGGNINAEKIWLVKVNEFGLFNSTDDIAMKIDEALVFPNPASEVVNIRLPRAVTGTLALYASSGQLLQKHNLEKQKDYFLLVDDLTSGIYTLLVYDQESNENIVLRFVKNE